MTEEQGSSIVEREVAACRDSAGASTSEKDQLRESAGSKATQQFFIGDSEGFEAVTCNDASDRDVIPGGRAPGCAPPASDGR